MIISHSDFVQCLLFFTFSGRETMFWQADKKGYKKVKVKRNLARHFSTFHGVMGNTSRVSQFLQSSSWLHLWDFWCCTGEFKDLCLSGLAVYQQRVSPAFMGQQALVWSWEDKREQGKTPVVRQTEIPLCSLLSGSRTATLPHWVWFLKQPVVLPGKKYPVPGYLTLGTCTNLIPFPCHRSSNVPGELHHPFLSATEHKL